MANEQLPNAFPIHPDTRRNYPHVTSVPWALVAPHEERAQRNHSQSLRRLAQRGGLTAQELYAVLNNLHWGDSAIPNEPTCVDWLMTKMANITEEAR